MNTENHTPTDEIFWLQSTLVFGCLTPAAKASASRLVATTTAFHLRSQTKASVQSNECSHPHWRSDGGCTALRESHSGLKAHIDHGKIQPLPIKCGRPPSTHPDTPNSCCELISMKEKRRLLHSQRTSDFQMTLINTFDSDTLQSHHWSGLGPVFLIHSHLHFPVAHKVPRTRRPLLWLWTALSQSVETGLSANLAPYATATQSGPWFRPWPCDLANLKPSVTGHPKPQWWHTGRTQTCSPF